MAGHGPHGLTAAVRHRRVYRVRMDDTAVSRPTVWSYLYWTLVGALLGFGIIGALTIGILFMAAAVALGFAGQRSHTLNNRSARGIIAGFAVAPLYLAWINRRGPGAVCTTIDHGTGISCGDQWSPWPFLAVAIAILIGFVVAVRRKDPGPVDRSGV